GFFVRFTFGQSLVVKVHRPLPAGRLVDYPRYFDGCEVVEAHAPLHPRYAPYARAMKARVPTRGGTAQRPISIRDVKHSPTRIRAAAPTPATAFMMRSEVLIVPAPPARSSHRP